MMEAVFEYDGLASEWDEQQVIIYSPGLGGRAVLSWTHTPLRRLYQWMWPTRGGWALGIEPANAPLFGAERDLPHAGAPLLQPGENFETRVSLRCEEDSTR